MSTMTTFLEYETYASRGLGQRPLRASVDVNERSGAGGKSANSIGRAIEGKGLIGLVRRAKDQEE